MVTVYLLISTKSTLLQKLTTDVCLEVFRINRGTVKMLSSLPMNLMEEK